MTSLAAATRSVPSRLAGRRLAEPAGWLLYAAIIAWLVLSGGVFEMYVAGLVIIYAISALGLDWIQGRAGQVSIGSAAFMAIGAYIAAVSAGLGAPVPLALILASMGGAFIGFIVGLPALRLRGLYLALSTLALHFITFSAALQFETAAGMDAGFFVPPATIGPITLQPGPSFLVTLAVILALVIVGLRNLYRRAPGRAWLAVKESETAAAVIGYNTTRWKLLAFVGSSALISFSGALLAYYTLRVFNDTFSLTFALSFVAMVIIGGLGSIPGVILGAALVTLSPYVLSTMTTQLPEGLPFASWLEVNVYYINNALFGVLVLVFLLYQPRGIAGGIQAGGRWLAARTRSTAAPAAEPSSAEPGRGGATTAIEGVPAPADHVASPQATRSTPSVNPPPVDSSAVLKVRNLQLVYRTGARAVDGIDLDVGAGEIVALLGRNGAGKTSTLRAISGFFVADKVVVSGSIQFEGRAIRGASPVVTSRRGVILVPERDKVFPSLTVSEHLALAGASPARRTEVAELFPALSQRTESLAGLLSGGERQMLALAMAWCLEPRLLLIDELSLGLAPAIVKRMMASVRELRDRTNVPILLVEQNLSAALDVADRVYVLEAGRLVMAANAGDVSREALLSSSFGDR